MKLRLGGLLAVVAIGALLVGPITGGSAKQQSAGPKTLQTVAVSGQTASGKQFTGTFAIRRFVVNSRNGHRGVYALGTLRGKVGNRRTPPRTTLIPVSTGSANGKTAQAAAACPVLHLVLGPVDLNLLGLKVHLNQVVLDITAQSGPGNLLGNLLCDVANLLNNNNPTAGQLAAILNAVSSILAGL